MHNHVAAKHISFLYWVVLAWGLVSCNPGLISPIPQGTPRPLQTAAAAPEAATPASSACSEARAGQLRDVSPATGLAFAYPSSWALRVERDLPQGFSLPRHTLVAPANEFPGGNVIEVWYADHEIGPAERLDQTVERYQTRHQDQALFPSTLLEQQNATTLDPCGVPRESVYEKRKDEFGVVQSLYLAQGSILLVISGYTTDEYAGPMRAALETVLASVQFSSTAPRSLRDLYALRGAAPSPSSAPTGNTSVPRPSTAQPHVEPGESPPAQGPPSATPGPHAEVPSGATLEGKGEPFGGPPRPVFTVVYSKATWEAQGSALHHRQLAHCRLVLDITTAEAAGPRVIATVMLGSQVWERTSYPKIGLVFYQTQQEQAHYGLQLEMPSSSQSTGDRPCQVDAERVIATFRVADEGRP